MLKSIVTSFLSIGGIGIITFSCVIQRPQAVAHEVSCAKYMDSLSIHYSCQANPAGTFFYCIEDQTDKKSERITQGTQHFLVMNCHTGQLVYEENNHGVSAKWRNEQNIELYYFSEFPSEKRKLIYVYNVISLTKSRVTEPE